MAAKTKTIKLTSGKRIMLTVLAIGLLLMMLVRFSDAVAAAIDKAFNLRPGTSKNFVGTGMIFTAGVVFAVLAGVVSVVPVLAATFAIIAAVMILYSLYTWFGSPVAKMKKDL